MNIIDEDSFDKLKEHVALKSTRAKLFAYNSTVPLPWQVYSCCVNKETV